MIGLSHRCFFQMLFFILVGTMVNLALAWALAAWLSITDSIALPNRPAFLGVEGSLCWNLWWVQRPGAARYVGFLKQDCPPHAESPHVPEWTALAKDPHLIPAVQRDSNLAVVDDARGLPFLALRCRFLVHIEPGLKLRAVVKNGIPVESNNWFTPLSGKKDLSRFALYPRALPCSPIWSGLIVNSILYGLFALLIVRGPRYVRTLSRLRRSRCVECGYDLKGLDGGCPECGWRRRGNGEDARVVK